jgi:hypothetical protein
MEEVVVRALQQRRDLPAEEGLEPGGLGRRRDADLVTLREFGVADLVGVADQLQQERTMPVRRIAQTLRVV